MFWKERVSLSENKYSFITLLPGKYKICTNVITRITLGKIFTDINLVFKKSVYYVFLYLINNVNNVIHSCTIITFVITLLEDKGYRLIKNLIYKHGESNRKNIITLLLNLYYNKNSIVLFAQYNRLVKQLYLIILQTDYQC